MRVYAMALGILLTVGYGCVAQLAVRSSGFEPVAAASRDATVPARPEPVWCGGTLPPITVEAYGVVRPNVMVTGFGRPGAAVPCTVAARRQDRVI